mgnify:CR=1 FL=1
MWIALVEADDTRCSILEDLGAQLWTNDLLILLLALQVEELINFLPWEEDCCKDDKEHVEGYLKVYLLPGHSLILHVQINIVRRDNEAHATWYGQGKDHAVHCIS